LLVNKLEILADDAWLTFLIEHAFNMAEPDEILRILSHVQVEVCDDCEGYLTSDGEVVMDCYACDNQHEYCLNCCKCPGDHEQGGYWS
jgi:hypothetical protein